MERARFIKLVEEALDALPRKFHDRVQNVALVVQDVPPGQVSRNRLRDAKSASNAPEEKLLMGVFEGTPATQRSVWDAPPGPHRIVLYQKNIEAVCDTEDEIREEVRLTVLHELGHYFGLSEDQLKDV